MAENFEIPEEQTEDPFKEFGGKSVSKKQDNSDPFAEFGGSAVKKKDTAPSVGTTSKDISQLSAVGGVSTPQSPSQLPLPEGTKYHDSGEDWVYKKGKWVNVYAQDGLSTIGDIASDDLSKSFSQKAFKELQEKNNKPKSTSSPSQLPSVNPVQIAQGKGMNGYKDPNAIGTQQSFEETNQRKKELDAQTEFRKGKQKEAVENTVARIYKAKNIPADEIDKNSVDYRTNLALTKQKLDNGILVVAKDKFGKNALTRPGGFGESAVDAFTESFKAPVKAWDINKAAALSVKDGDKNLIDLLDKKIAETPEIPEYNPQFAGQMVGGAVKPVSIGMIPYVGLGALTAEAGWTSYANQLQSLYQRGLSEGLSKEDAVSRAKKAAILNAGVDAAGMYALGKIGVKAPSVAAEAKALDKLKMGLTSMAKSSASVGGLMGSGELVKSGAEKTAGYNITTQETADNFFKGVKDGAIMDVAFKVAHGAIAAPGFVKSLAKDYLAKLPEGVVKEELANNPKAQPIQESLDKYNASKQMVDGLVPEDQTAHFAGLNEKKINLEKNIADLQKQKEGKSDALTAPIDEKIKSVKDEVAAITKQMGEAQVTGKITEIDGETGETHEIKKDEIVTDDTVPKEPIVQESSVPTNKTIEPSEFKEGDQVTLPNGKKGEISEIKDGKARVSVKGFDENGALPTRDLGWHDLADIEGESKPIEKTKEAGTTVLADVKKLNILGADIGFNKPERGNYEDGEKGDLEYANANMEHNKKVDETIGSLTQEGTLTDSQGNKYLVTITGQGVRVVNKMADGTEGNDISYRKGQRNTANTPFTKGFSFKPKEPETIEPATKVEPKQEGGEGDSFALGENKIFFHASDTKRNGRLNNSNAPQFGTGVYFSTNKDLVTNEFGKHLTEAELTINKPVYTNTKEWRNVEKEAIRLADEQYGKEKGLKLGEDETYFRYDHEDSSELDEIASHHISDAAKKLGYDAIIDKDSHAYENEIVVLDETKIKYPEDSAKTKQPKEASSNSLSVNADKIRRGGTNSIEFSKPIIGKNGAKLLSYTWESKDFGKDKFGNPIRFSDWEKAGVNADTGRNIVHKFKVEVDGKVMEVSADSVAKALGFTDAEMEKVFPKAKEFVKQLAKMKMREQALVNELEDTNEAVANAVKKVSDKYGVKIDVYREGDNVIASSFGMPKDDLMIGDNSANELVRQELRENEVYFTERQKVGTELNRVQRLIENKKKQASQIGGINFAEPKLENLKSIELPNDTTATKNTTTKQPEDNSTAVQGSGAKAKPISAAGEPTEPTAELGQEGGAKEVGSGVEGENKIQSWVDKWEELKKSDDVKELDLFYNKVKVALNGYAQGKDVVKEFESLKADIEKYAKERKEPTQEVKGSDLSHQRLYAEINKSDEATDAHGLALQYIAGGGKINEAEIKKLYDLGTRKSGEVSDRKYVSKDGKTIDQVAHSIWDNLPEHLQDKISTSDIANSLEEVIGKHNTRQSAAVELYDKHGVEHQPKGLGIDFEKAKELQQQAHELDTNLSNEEQAELEHILSKYEKEDGTVDWKKMKEDFNDFDPDYLTLPTELQNKLDGIVSKHLTEKSEPSNATNADGIGEDKKSKSPNGEPTESTNSTNSTDTQQSDGGKQNTSAKDLGTKARQLSEKLRKGDANVLPSFLRADVKDAKTSGISINEAFANALDTFADVHDATKDFAKAVKKGVQHLKDWYDENGVKYNGKELTENFSKHLEEQGIAEEPIAAGDGNLVGIAHDALNDLAEKIGLPPIERGTVFTPEQYADRGRALLKAGVDPYKLDDYKGSLDNKISVARSQVEILAKKADIIKDKSSQAYKDAAKEWYDYSKNVAKTLGTQAGEAMRALQGRRDLDTDSFTEVSAKVKDYSGSDLTVKQQADIETLTTKNQELNKQLEEANNKLIEATDSELNNPTAQNYNESQVVKEAEERFNRLKEEHDQIARELKRLKDVNAKKESKPSNNEGLQNRQTGRKEKIEIIDKRIDSNFDSIRAKLKAKRNQLNSNPVPVEIIPELIVIARDLITKGTIKAADIVDVIYNRLKDDLDGATKRDLSDAMSGYGETTKPSEDPNSKLWSEAKGVMRLTSAIEDANNGKQPLKSGFQRPEPTKDLRDLRKQLNDAIKKNQINAVDGEKHMKSLLDAAKTRMKNSIDDLTKAIKRNEKLPKRESGIKYDDDANDLKAKLSKLREKYDATFGTDKELTPQEKEQRRVNALEKQLEDLQNGVVKSKPGSVDISEREKDLKDQIFNAKSKLGLVKSKEVKFNEHQLEMTDAEKKIERLEKQKQDLEDGIVKQREVSNEKPSPQQEAKIKELEDDIYDEKQKLGLIKSKVKALTEDEIKQQNIDAANDEAEAKANKLKDLQTQFVDKQDNKFTPDEAKEIWNYIKTTYLDNGVKYVDAISLAKNDLGLTFNQVSNAIVTPKLKAVSDAVWKKRYDLNKNRSATQRYIDDQTQAPALRAFRKITNLPRELAVFGHGGVFVGTHAGMTLMDVPRAGHTVKAFINAYKLAYGKDVLYEKMMTDLKTSPNYVLAQRAKLLNNPDFINADSEVLKPMFGRISESGTRGFNAIKILRQKLFDSHWDALSADEKMAMDKDGIPMAAKSIAQLVNNATGGTNIKIPKAIEEITFAGGMEASRWEKLLANPAKAANIASKILLNPKEATVGEKVFLKVWSKRVATEMVTYLGLITVNAAIQSQLNPNNKVNLTDYKKSDWLKMKVGDITIDFTSGMLSTAHFIVTLASIPFSSKKERYNKTEDDTFANAILHYGRGKLAPAYSLAADVATSHDFSGNTMPYSKEKPYHGFNHKMTYAEFGASKLPIPVAEAARTFYESAKQGGVNDNVMKHVLKGFGYGVFSGTTGFKAYEGKEKKHSKE